MYMTAMYQQPYFLVQNSGGIIVSIAYLAFKSGEGVLFVVFSRSGGFLLLHSDSWLSPGLGVMGLCYYDWPAGAGSLVIVQNFGMHSFWLGDWSVVSAAREDG